MRNKIIKKLNKKPYPDGHFNFKWRICKVGARDYKYSQLCIWEEKYQTPWLLEKIRCLAEYDNRIYCKVDKELEPLANEIASECKELEALAKRSEIPENLDRENKERLIASFGCKARGMEKRRSEILIHLSEMEMALESIDLTLQHHLQCAENVMMKHVSIYWSGVLKAASSTDMPPKPDLEIPDIPGKAVYEAHFHNIRERLYRVLNCECQKEEV